MKTEFKNVIVRTEKAGVFFGNIDSLEGTTANMSNVRRLWYWDGASSLSELAENGVSRPDNCKFPIAVQNMIVFGVLEVIICSEQATKSINEVKIWTQHK